MLLKFCPADGTELVKMEIPDAHSWAFATKCPKCGQRLQYISSDRMSGSYVDTIDVYDLDFRFKWEKSE